MNELEFGVWESPAPAIPDVEAFEQELRRDRARVARIRELEREIEAYKRREGELVTHIVWLETRLAEKEKQHE